MNHIDISPLNHSQVVMDGFGFLQNNIPNYYKSNNYSIGWYHCRDLFFSFVLLNPYFYYRSSNKDNTINYIRAIEQHLNVEEKSELGSTQYFDILYFKYSSFWKNSTMRLSLLSAFLKVGHVFDGNDIFAPLKSSTYLTATKQAVEKFLDGHTVCTIKVTRHTDNGWYCVFKNNQNLDTLHKPHDLISSKAYSKWKNAGEPKDCGDKFWKEAEQEVYSL